MARLPRREKPITPDELRALALAAGNPHAMLVEYNGGYWAPPWPNDKRNARGVPAEYVRGKAINGCMSRGLLLPVKYGQVKITDAGQEIARGEGGQNED